MKIRFFIALTTLLVCLAKIRAAEAGVSLLLCDLGEGVFSVAVRNAGAKSFVYRDGEWRGVPAYVGCGNCAVSAPLTELKPRAAFTDYFAVPNWFRSLTGKKIRARLGDAVSNDITFEWYQPPPNPFLQAFYKKS